ncbi:MAG: 1-(5-phosphoribosyl)-5-[Oscillospiraceae bacterium]|nr:1-(5-phosphoribosyl)-5-[(5-phosphoribosylamino)methylideneamino]imidazole-4-carboxamide isomerase [Oscillospiraceae bacterium]
MIVLPAIDLVGGKAVRLFQGDYNKMTVYNENPADAARSFQEAGAAWLHVVDLEGARDGGTPNLPSVARILRETKLQVELGGGVRDMETVERYLELGVRRVILGTAAVRDRAFLEAALGRFGSRVAVGVDLRDGFVAIRGWREVTDLPARDFCAELAAMGLQTLICTDISRDGAMRGTNRQLYRELNAALGLDLIASGGVSTLEDLQELKESGVYAAIVGKALYTGDLRLPEALEAAR